MRRCLLPAPTPSILLAVKCGIPVGPHGTQHRCPRSTGPYRIPSGAKVPIYGVFPQLTGSLQALPGQTRCQTPG